MPYAIEKNPDRKIHRTHKGLSVFEKYLTVWVVLCMAGGILLGKTVPEFAGWLDGLAIYVNQAPVISVPIAVCLFFMMYPIMVKIDFAEVLKAGKSIKPVGLTLFVNWGVWSTPACLNAIKRVLRSSTGSRRPVSSISFRVLSAF